MEALWKIQSGSFRGEGRLYFGFVGRVLLDIPMGKHSISVFSLRKHSFSLSFVGEALIFSVCFLKKDPN